MEMVILPTPVAEGVMKKVMSFMLLPTMGIGVEKVAAAQLALSVSLAVAKFIFEETKEYLMHFP
jgi:hypothetical protein